MASFHGLYRTVTFYAPTVPQTGCTNSGLSITNPNKCTIFCFKKIPQNPTELCITFQSPPIWVPPAPPQKKMAKRCKKDQRNPLSWWIFGKLNTRCTKLLCMPQHLEPPLTKSSTQRGPRHSANEQPVKIQWVLKTHGVLFVEIQENPMKIIVFFIYIYILFAFWFIFGKRRLLYIQHTVHRVLRDKGGNSYHR